MVERLLRRAHPARVPLSSSIFQLTLDGDEACLQSLSDNVLREGPTFILPGVGIPNPWPRILHSKSPRVGPRSNIFFDNTSLKVN